MHPWVKNWQDILDSLATSGGNIVTLFMCSFWSGVLWVWVYNHSARAELVMATFGVFTGFTGALLQAQKGNPSRQQMTNNVETSGGLPVPPAVIAASSSTTAATQAATDAATPAASPAWPAIR